MCAWLFLCALFSIYLPMKTKSVNSRNARLVGGLTPNQGRLEVSLTGKYGPVCDDNWSLREAQVVCKMLGFPDATHVVKNDFFGFHWSMSVVMGNVRCQGNETSLFDCSFVEVGSGNGCDTVGLVCGRLSVKFQLVGGRSPNEGRIEVAFGDQHMGMRKPWTLYCDHNWTMEDAAVVCRMLGYQDAMFTVGANMFSEGNGMYFLLQDLQCLGNESSVADCKYDSLKEHSECPEVGVICGKRNSTIPMRLAGGSSFKSGRVELNLGGHWGTVCQNKWSLNNARVVCRSFGLHEAAIATVGSVFGPGNGRIILDNVECNGNESSLLKCRHDKLGSKSCTSEQEAGVLCEKPEVRFQISGNGSTSKQGVVQVNMNGIIGSICSVGWDTKDASVLCRMLGLGEVGYPVNNAAYGPASGVTLLRDVSCYGNETDLMSCDRDVIGYKVGCSHGNDAGVICSSTKVRLAGGPTWNHGRVEILIEESWSRAIRSDYSLFVAEVVCTMIGLPAMGYTIFEQIYSIENNNSAFISDINCRSGEIGKTILECPFKYRQKIADPSDYRVSCGPLSGSVSIINITSSAHDPSFTTPEYAVDNDKTTCFFINMKGDTFFTIILNKEVYVHSVFVIAHPLNTSLRVTVQPLRKQDKSVLCTIASKFKTKQGKIYECSPPTLSRQFKISADVVNTKFGLCNVDVFVFGGAAESHGALQEYWAGDVDRRRGDLMKYNSYFASHTSYVFTTNEFQIKRKYRSKAGKRLSSFFTIPSSKSKKYNFLVSCDDECELWFKNVAEEGLGKEETSLDYIIKLWFKTDQNVYDKYESQKSKTLPLSHCHMYYIEGYLSSYRGNMHMNVKIQEENGELNNLKEDLLFWTLPGKRNLYFDLTNAKNGSLYGDFESIFTFQGNYSFCCQGVFCPSCSIHLSLRFASIPPMKIDPLVNMDCYNRTFSKAILLNMQPGNYTLEIEYFFNGDTTNWSQRRNVGILVVSENIVQECDFTNGKVCPGWRVEGTISSGLWEVQKGSGLEIKSQGTSRLESPIIPLGPNSTKLCLRFEYKLPSNDSSAIEVSAKSLKDSDVIWFLAGFHGNSWHQAKVPLAQPNNIKVVFTGVKSSNSSQHIAIRSVKMTTKVCTLAPSFASAAHQCSKEQFKCSNGECAPQSSRCNGVFDGCRDGSDEKECKCLSNQFQCSNDQCVNVEKLCDGVQDCADGMDETHCDTENKCKEVTCFDGECKTWSAACLDSAQIRGISCPVSSVECKVHQYASSEFNTKCSGRQGYCGFESGMCSLHPLGNSSQSWLWTSAKDSAVKSILSKDHTTMTYNGSYVYLFQSSVFPNKLERLSSNTTKPPKDVLCLQFWYFVHGPSSLRVFISTNSSEMLAWNHTGNTKEKWVFGQTTIQKNTDYRFIFEGTNQNKGDFIAIDDLSLLNNKCKSMSFKENPNCDFDVKMCGWKGHEDWKIKKDPLHGRLLHLVGGSQSERSVSSPLFNPIQDGWKCVSFWLVSTYQFYQRHIKLQVIDEDGKELRSLWTYGASVTNITYLQFLLPPVDADVKVAFSAIKKQGQPVIAISKVLFLKEECQEIKPIAECHSYQVLDSIERRVSNTVPKKNSDESLHWHTWYRITGAAGNQIPTSCIKRNHCGSEYPVHAKGSNPTSKYETENITECKTFNNKCCQSTGGMKIRHCGNFYVYREISVTNKDEKSQVCSTYKEVVPVYDKSKEWDSWRNTDIQNKWKAIYRNNSLLNDRVQLSQDMQEIHLMHNSTVEIKTSEVEEPRRELSICFWINALGNERFSVDFLSLRNQASLFAVLVLNNTLVVRLKAQQNRSVNTVVLDGMWHHICVTWKSYWGLWHVFQDGYLVGKGMYLGDGMTIRSKAGTMLRLSKKVKNNSSNSSDNLSFIRMSNVNIWREVLSGEEIVRMSYGCDSLKLGSLVAWYEITNDDSLQKSQHPATCLGISSSARVLRSESSDGPTSGTYQSPWFNRSIDSNKKCLKFKYKFMGTGPMSLTVFQTLKHPDIKDRRVWITRRRTDSVWQLGQVQITTMSLYRITIKGHLSNHGYIAIGGLHETSDQECYISPEEAKYACNENLNSADGLITSPNYPTSYPEGIACTWKVNVTSGHVIRLEFKAFDLEDSEKCKKESLAIYDGSLIRKYCGSIYPGAIESSNNSVQLSFTSKANASSYHSGFRIHYYAVKENIDRDCIRDCPSECTCTRQQGSLIVQGKKLFAIPRVLPRETTAILYPNNKIFELKSSDFIRLSSLKYLNLEWNKILRIRSETFSVNVKLQTLKLNHNFLKTILPGALNGLRELKTLDLGQNLLSNLEERALYGLPSLETLNLQSNRLSSLDHNPLAANTKLLHLYLQDNAIAEIPDGLFKNQTKLKVLYLSNNRIKHIKKASFMGLSSLERLYLDDNDLVEADIDQNTFEPLRKLRYIKLDSFVVCCYAKKQVLGLVCDSPGNELSSCEDLLKNSTLRVFIWILGTLALLGNIAVVFYWNRMANIDRGERGNKSRVQSFLLTNLAVSDLLMGVYLVIIGAHDLQYKGKYFQFDVQWRSSGMCQFAGALSMVASEVSVLILATITADRFNSIVFHIKARPFTIKTARIVCGLIWCLTLFLSCIPMFITSYFYDAKKKVGFYGRSSVCLPLHLSKTRPAGWEYAVTIYIAFNGLAFLFILLAYVAIFYKVKTSSKRVRSNINKDSSLALRVVLIILTDFLCWIPVVIIGCLSLLGDFHDPEGQAYAWIAVFVLPINSSINPLLYTFSNPQFRKLFDLRELFHSSNKTSKRCGETHNTSVPKVNQTITGATAMDSHYGIMLKSPKISPQKEHQKSQNRYFKTKL